ncbi:MAG: type IV conjugative transfer system coupling protein TraD [Pseudomonadota bacterium]
MAQHFTRGGQLSMHRLRMLQQVARITLAVILFTAMTISIGKTLYEVPSYNFYLFKEYYHGKFLLGFVTKQTDIHKATQQIIHPDGRKTQEYSINIVQSPWVNYAVAMIKYKVWHNTILGLWIGVFVGLSAMVFFFYRGRKQAQEKRYRGSALVPPQQLKKMIKRNQQASDLKLDKLPLINNMETSHFLACGTTGSGKSTLIRTLLPQIRRRGDRAIIVDLTGEFVAQYYQPKHDILLNPFDDRHQPWSPWKECQNESHYDAFAHAMVPSSKQNDPFWETSGRIVLATALRQFKEQGNFSAQSLYRLLSTGPIEDYQQFFAGTEATSFTGKEGDKTTASIRSTLATHLQGLKYLKDARAEFSIREWISQDRENSWLFLNAQPDQRQALKSLMTTWMDTSISALMSLPPSSDRRVWFILDELPALHKLPSLEMALAEIRKYGGCVMAGFQSMAQLTSVYGASTAEALLNLFNTQVFFRNVDPRTTEWIAKVLGEQEIRQVQENLSYGADTVRDGVSLSQQDRKKLIVLPTEIAALKNLECYLKLPEGYPVAKVKIRYKGPRIKLLALIKKRYNSMMSVFRDIWKK